ncbi:MAG: hypothetical protein HZA89_01005 [Verrucomicrobia bacterium]|nr:hypothetical protein [Verrucomicrobiota bacterium]
MSLKVSRSQLATLTRNLMGQWELAKAHWQDARSAEFQARYLDPLQTEMTAALEAMDKLDAVLGKIRSDCE